MLKFNTSEIPESMKKEHRWITWRAEKKEDRVTKIPYNPHDPTGTYKAATNKPKTWGTLEQALNHAKACNMSGIGFVLTGEYFGVDLDHVRNPETGELIPAARDIISQMNTYTEVSPSGTGVHLIGHTPLEFPGTKKKMDGGSWELELYTRNSARYLTVTGHRIGNGDIRESTDALQAMIGEYLPNLLKGEITNTHTKQNSEVAKVSVPSNHSTRAQADSLGLDPSYVWERIRQSKHGPEIMALAGGDISKYGDDDSDADMGMLCHLAYWTGNNESLMDEMYRQTVLFAQHLEKIGPNTWVQKWDRVHYADGDTYGHHTITKAIELNGNNFAPYIARNNAFNNAASTAPNTGAQNNAAGTANQSVVSTEDSELNLLNSPRTVTKGEYGRHRYSEDAAVFVQFKERSTGWAPLDAVHGPLLPGLYTLGAVTSLGKTTFCLQLADYLAVHEKCHVLYFSIEQSPFELYTKGVARAAFENELDGYSKPQKENYVAPLARDFRYGLPQFPDNMGELAASYNVSSEHFTIVDCGFALTAGAIKATVEAYIKKHPAASVVVFVDYIQAVLSDNAHMAERQTIDNTVRTLKQLNRDNPGLTIFAVSSISRAAYLQPINLESFKESGGIEFTSDVVWGLELGIMSDSYFQTTEGKELLRKHNILDAAKKANPREVRLRCLKNRSGAPTYQCPFYYYPAHEFFYALEKQDLDASGEYPLTAQNHWRGMLEPISGMVKTEKCEAVQIGTVTLDPGTIAKLVAGSAKLVYMGITPPEKRAGIRHLKPADAKAQLMTAIGDRPREFPKYSDFPDLGTN